MFHPLLQCLHDGGPGIANMAVTGLVALPGTMIGQILGGSSPHVAIKYQIMIVVITVVASMLSLMMTIFLARRWVRAQG